MEFVTVLLGRLLGSGTNLAYGRRHKSGYWPCLLKKFRGGVVQALDLIIEFGLDEGSVSGVDFSPWYRNSRQRQYYF